MQKIVQEKVNLKMSKNILFDQLTIINNLSGDWSEYGSIIGVGAPKLKFGRFLIVIPNFTENSQRVFTKFIEILHTLTMALAS